MIDLNRQKDLVQLLNNYDVGGTPFYVAKKELLAKGYTEPEIVYALYSAPFDGKANTPAAPNPLTEMYENHPERAEKIARNLLAVEAEKEWDSTMRAAVNQQVAYGARFQSQADVALADSLGIPYFSILAGSLLFVLIAVFAGVPEWITRLVIAVVSISLNVWVVGLLVARYRRLRRLRKQTKLDK